MELELSKILAKTMHNSYKRKEIQDRMERIILRIDNQQNPETNSAAVRKVRMELEEIRKQFYGLK